MEVDRTIADAAAPEIRDERLAEQVQQRSAEEDRDAGCPGMRIDLLEVGRDRAARVEAERADLVTVAHGDTVHFEERAHDLHVADVRHVAQDTGGLPEERRHHRLGREVLRALHLDPTGQRTSAADRQDFSGGLAGSRGGLGIADE